MMKTDILCTKIQTFLLFCDKKPQHWDFFLLYFIYGSASKILQCFIYAMLFSFFRFDDHHFSCFFLTTRDYCYFHPCIFFLLFSLTFVQVEIAAEWIFTAGMIASVLQNIALSSVFRSSSSIYETFIGWCFQRLSFPCFKLSLCPNSISSYLKAEARAKFW